MNPFLAVLALVGIYQAYKRGGRYRYMVALFISLLFLLFTHRHRFASGQGMVLSCFFAAVVLEALWNRLALKNSRVYPPSPENHGCKAVEGWALSNGGCSAAAPSRSKASARFRCSTQGNHGRKLSVLYQTAFWVFLLSVFHVFSIVYSVSPVKGESRFVYGDSLMSHWFGMQKRPQGPKEVSIYPEKFIEEVVSRIKANTREDDIVFSNFSYGGGMLALFAHRATSGAMLAEVMPFKPFDPIQYSRLILWFKNPDGSFSGDLTAMIEKYGLEKAGETSLVYLYLNDNAHVKRKIIPASLPSSACLAIFLAILAILLVENGKMRPLKGRQRP